MSSVSGFRRLLVVLKLDSIRSKIVALAVLATLAPALSTAFLSYVQNRLALTETLQGELRRIGSQSSRELDLWARDHRYDVRVFASSFEITENLELIPEGGPLAVEALGRMNGYMQSIVERFPDYAELRVFGAEHRSIATTRGALDMELPPGWVPALRRNETVVGDPYWDEALDAVAYTVVQPVLSGRYLGALMATIHFGGLRETLQELAPGASGQIDVVMREGRTVVSTARGEPLEPVLPDPVLERLVADEGGTVEFAADDGTESLGSLTAVPNMDWSVVTLIPSAEAYAQMDALRRTTTFLVLALLLLVGAIAYFLGQVIVRPLGRLAAGAAAVAEGDLSVDLPVRGGGEVGFLTEVFNRMVGQLRRSQEELSAANEALRQQNEELERLSMTDALTGLFNRRYVMGEFEREIRRAGRHERQMAVLMIDVDRFKQYNDAHGHQAGDEVLMGMGRVIEDATREHDIPGRYGGEEFITLLPDCDLPGALDAARRIRERLEEESFSGGRVTCSIGAAAFPEHGTSPNGLIAAADAALYAAKEAGRDRVLAAGDVPEALLAIEAIAKAEADEAEEPPASRPGAGIAARIKAKRSAAEANGDEGGPRNGRKSPTSEAETTSEKG